MVFGLLFVCFITKGTTQSLCSTPAKKSINVAPAGKLAPSSKLCLGLMVNFQIVVLMAPVDYDVLKSFNPKSVANEQFKKNSNLRFLK